MQTDTDPNTDQNQDDQTPETDGSALTVLPSVDLSPEPEIQPPVDLVAPEASDLSLAPDAGFTIHPDGSVDLNEDMTPGQYTKGLQLFKWAQSKMKLSFSAYIKKGREKFGRELVDAGVTQLEFDMPTVQAALDISTIPEDIRQPGLEAEHYIVLARSDTTPASKKKWARIASEQKLSPGILKRSIEAGEVVSGGGTGSTGGRTGIISVHGVRQEAEVWLKRVKGIEGIMLMTAAERKEVLGELKFFVDLYNDINKMVATKPKKPVTKVSKTSTKKKAAKKK